jgi:hypothetical protein
MRTTILAYAIAVMSVIMIFGGLSGLFYSLIQASRAPLRYYAMAIGMLCGGLAMAGLAQALRLLLIIVTRGA